MSLMTLNHADMAELMLRRSEKTFRNLKPKLYELGMPAPLDIPGDTVWDRAEVEAWLTSRRQAVATPRKRGQAGQKVIAEIRQQRRDAEAAAPAEQPAKRKPGRPRKVAPVLQEGGAA